MAGLYVKDGQTDMHKLGTWLKVGALIGLVGVGGAVAWDRAGAAGVSPVPPAASRPPEAGIPGAILPHRAHYKLELASARNHSSVRGASGEMTSSWEDACDGWTIAQNLDISFTYDEPNDNQLSSTYTTWESKDGQRYRFSYRRSHNGQLAEELRGNATLDHPGGSGTATYTVPERREVVLPPGSYFPTAHTLRLIQAGQAGQPSMLSATVFDGSDEEGINEVSAVLGSGKPLMSDITKAALPPGSPSAAWPVRLAFFSLKADQTEPNYEMDTNLLPNGISEFMLIDYGDFKLRGTLDKIELLPEPDC